MNWCFFSECFKFCICNTKPASYFMVFVKDNYNMYYNIVVDQSCHNDVLRILFADSVMSRVYAENRYKN